MRAKAVKNYMKVDIVETFPNVKESYESNQSCILEDPEFLYLECSGFSFRE
jgi:hypothetical protein